MFIVTEYAALKAITLYRTTIIIKTHLIWWINLSEVATQKKRQNKDPNGK